MRRTLGLAVLSVVVAGGYLWHLSAQSSASALQGAWTIQSVTSPQPPVNPRRNPKGLIVISGNHYAQVGVGDTMRPSFPEGGAAKATADQLRAVWGPVIADAGTFTVSGNTIKLTASVAKGTAAMAPGNFAEGTFTVSGDNLTVTQVRNQAGPIANPVTVRAVRAK
jgi:Lipocalin-like domain